jgi:uncharacterized protein YdcH (DUF465 family)
MRPVPAAQRSLIQTARQSSKLKTFVVQSVPLFLRQTKPRQMETDPMDLHHPILREFPEHRETIRRLKGADDHFRHLYSEYHRLDDEIYRIEEEIDFATDQETEELKMRRAKLKDYIYHIIRHAPPCCPDCDGTGLARASLGSPEE